MEKETKDVVEVMDTTSDSTTTTTVTSTSTTTTAATDTVTSTATATTITITSASPPVTVPAEDAQETKKEIIPPPPVPVVRVPVKHSNLGIRSHAMDMSTMVELTSFSTLGKIEPFLVTLSANAALVVDLHCHLSDKEVCGYLGGHWDINGHNLSILGAYPCRYTGKDKAAAAAVEAEISRAMEWKRMILVGWYHSHPRSHASPTLRDVDSQLDYEIKMKGPSDTGYTPCVGLICSPYNTDANCYESNFNIFWSMPPPENRPHEYPRPMLLSYTLTQEQYVCQDALEEIKKCIEFYRAEGGIDFTTKFNSSTTYLERLKNSLSSKLPGRCKTGGSYWEIIKEMVAPGFDDGTESPFANLKFPLLNDPLLQASSNVFLSPLSYKPENSIAAVQKAYMMQQQHLENLAAESNHIKDSKQSSHIINTSDGVPTFRAGDLTVSLKSSKDYDYSPTDFTKIESMKGRSEYPITDLTQAMKFPDLSKFANFSPAELAKITGFSLNDFTKAASSSAYVRNIANLFGPLGKGLPDFSDSGNDRRSSDFPDLTAPFKPPTTSSPAPKETNRSTSTSQVDEYVDKKKTSLEAMDTSTSYSEDLSMTSSTLDMSKKQHDSVESLNLTKERQ